MLSPASFPAQSLDTGERWTVFSGKRFQHRPETFGVTPFRRAGSPMALDEAAAELRLHPKSRPSRVSPRTAAPKLARLRRSTMPRTTRPRIRLLAALAVLSGLGLVAASPATADTSLYHEQYRPQFHFTPAENWM